MGNALQFVPLDDPGLLPDIREFVASQLRSPGIGELKRSFVERFTGRDPAAAAADALVTAWGIDQDTSPTIETMNDASIGAFLDHTASLERLTASDAIKKSRWPNLPYWMECIWLPLESTPAAPLLKYRGSWPTFISTAGGLIADLTEIATVSDMNLGAKPRYFDLMMSNPPRFYSQSHQFDAQETLQWIWFAHMTGAEMAIANNVPLASGG